MSSLQSKIKSLCFVDRDIFFTILYSNLNGLSFMQFIDIKSFQGKRFFSTQTVFLNNNKFFYIEITSFPKTVISLHKFHYVQKVLMENDL
jgi:hypothetical protein